MLVSPLSGDLYLIYIYLCYFFSDEYLTLKGHRNPPIIKQAVRWKFTPMGWDAFPQIWYTGLTNSNNREAWYTITQPIGRELYHRWQKSYAKRERTLPPGKVLDNTAGLWGFPPFFNIVFLAKALISAIYAVKKLSPVALP